MRYALAMLTHGDHEDWFSQTVTSFLQHVPQPPAEVIVHNDVAGEGFALATRRLWDKAAATDCDYVFWLEHDFLFTRHVYLADLAAFLDANPYLAQMALYREPVTLEEQQAGGYLNQRAELFTRRGHWYEQASWWSTNPCLMRTETLRWHPWPPVPDCEVVAARLALIMDPSIRFGVWSGDGTPQVRHIGHRDGHGY